MKHFAKTLRNERGVAIPLMAVVLVVLIGFTGFGVDVGRIGLIADEVQNAADVAATAGAMQLVSPDESGDTALQSAQNILGQNTINNSAVLPSHLIAFETGNYDAGVFTADLAPINAVRAEVSYTVNNIVMSGLGFPTSNITKESVAAFQPASGGRPTIPITIGECLLGDECDSTSCDVTLTQVPNPDDNSAWTGFFETASTNEISGFFPSECGGDPSTVPTINVGDQINLINGQSVPLLNLVACMLENDLTEVVVPITECGGSLNQSREVLGFARFEIVAVRTNGGNKGIDIHGLTSAIDGPPGGPNDFGAGLITMVR